MSGLATIWRSLWRFHKLLAGIIVIEYALTFAIVLVAINVLGVRMDALAQPSGIRGQHVFVLGGKALAGSMHRFQIQHAEQLFASVAGVQNVAVLSSVPFLGNNAISMQVSLPDRGDTARARASFEVNVYKAGAGFAHTLGVRFVSGRNFQADEVAHHVGSKVHVVILSQSLAQRLFHKRKALGNVVDVNGSAALVVGVIAPLAAPNYLGNHRTMQTMLIPEMPAATMAVVAIRYKGEPDALYDALHTLQDHDSGRVNWWLSAYPEIRSNYFRSDRAAAMALAGIVIVVMLTALCGLAGLTTYWVAQRRSQIAIRRALGANKLDITIHFLIESGMLFGIGLAVGVCVEFWLATAFGMLPFSSGTLVWLASIMLVAVLAVASVFASLKSWLKRDPANLLRNM